MHAQQQTRIRSDRLFVVREPRAIGGANFPKLRAGLRHDLRHAKRAADFHQFAARDDYLAAFGECVQCKQNRRRTVVYYDRCELGFAGLSFCRAIGSKQTLEESLHMDIAFAALSRVEVKFQIGIARRDADEVLEGIAREGRASQIGMEDYAGGVDDFLERMPERAPQFALNCFGNAVDGKLRSVFLEAARGDFLAQAIENGADRVSSSHAALAFE